jgi:DNA-nicking Smr family endonuclease
MAKRPLSEEEKALLVAAMQDVVPLNKKKRAEKPEPVRRRPKISVKNVMLPELPVASKGMADKGTVARLASGEYEVQGKLDLHGLTLEEAYKKLKSFIEKHYRKGSRCVLIITGKGSPGQLAREVPRWLSLSDMAAQILVVSMASPKHGGSGALYVLLRKHR